MSFSIPFLVEIEDYNGHMKSDRISVPILIAPSLPLNHHCLINAHPADPG
jgi:hypothetical protein